jgi:hypothetical protein
MHVRFAAKGIPRTSELTIQIMRPKRGFKLIDLDRICHGRIGFEKSVTRQNPARTHQVDVGRTMVQDMLQLEGADNKSDKTKGISHGSGLGPIGVRSTLYH